MIDSNISREKKYFRAEVRLELTKAQKWEIKVVGLLIGFLCCGIVCTIIVPGSFFKFFAYLFKGCFSTPGRILKLLEETSILLLISFALAPAFKMKFWNIGAEGQVLMGALGCLIGMKFIAPSLSNVNFIAIILELIISLGFGIIWAFIPAFFKAYFGCNETLFTLMMNYVAKGIILLLTTIWYPVGSGQIPSFSTGILPEIGGYDYIINIIVVVGISVLLTIYLLYSKHGYEISVIGGSENTARYVGINVKKTTIRTMILSGALCGLAGFLITAGANHTVQATSAGGRGFTAILICWLSSFNPLEMAMNSFIVALITNGSTYAKDQLHAVAPFENIVVGIFFFVIIASTFFLNYKIKSNWKIVQLYEKAREKVINFFKGLFNKKSKLEEESK